MADDVTAGELDRRLGAHEQRTDRIHGELDQRITNLAKDTVPLDLYNRGERDRDRELQRLETEHDEGMDTLRREHAADIRQVREEIKELRDRPAMTLGKWLGVLTVTVAFLALMVQAWGTWKGAK